jgi:anti-anti-sigma factor
MNLTLLPLQNDEVIRIRCDGDVTLRGLASGSDPLEALLGPRYFGQKVLLNLEKAQAIDTSGLSWLLRVQDRFRQSNGRLVLVALPPRVTQMLDFLRLTPLLTTAPTEAAALASAAEGPPAAGKNGPREPGGQPSPPAG